MIVGSQRLMVWIAVRSHIFGCLVKEREETLIAGGKIIQEGLRKHNLSEHDLLEDLRLNGNIERADDVQSARIERSGEISVIPKEA